MTETKLFPKPSEHPIIFEEKNWREGSDGKDHPPEEVFEFSETVMEVTNGHLIVLVHGF